MPLPSEAMAKHYESFELEKRRSDIDEVYNESAKYVMFDEDGKPVDEDQSPSQITSTTTLKTIIDHNITESGDAYAIPDLTKNTIRVDIENDEKYECIENDNTKNVKVAHNLTESGAAYAVPNKSGSNQIEKDRENGNYATLSSQEDQQRVVSIGDVLLGVLL